MRKMKFFTRCTILATTPTLLVYPQHNQSYVTSQVLHYSYQQQTQEWVRPNTYDEIIQMLEDLESGEFERRYSPMQLEKVNDYLATLAKEGILHDELQEEIALEEDIYELMYGEDSAFQLTHSLENSHQYMLMPAVHNGTSDYDVIPCGNFSKAWKKTKKFVKKHKKEIIIGAVVVVAVTVIAVAVVAASSASAATAVAGAAGAAASAGEGATNSNHSEPRDEVSPEIQEEITAPITEVPLMKATLDEHVTSLKEFLIEDMASQEATGNNGWWDEMSFGEKARELGANIAHQAFDEVADLMKVVPQLCEEVKELGGRLLPSLKPPDAELIGSPLENYENLVAKGHGAIDKVFSTDQADLFTAEAKANDPRNNFTIGIIPLPGMIYKNGNINVKAFSKLGSAPDRAGFTKAGRGSMKHGYRQGKTVFEKPVGNPTQINDHGQKVLENILKHPDKVVIQYTNNKYGPLIEIEAPDLGGVRFSGDGKEMIGFIEPYWLKK